MDVPDPSSQTCCSHSPALVVLGLSVRKPAACTTSSASLPSQTTSCRGPASRHVPDVPARRMVLSSDARPMHYIGRTWQPEVAGYCRQQQTAGSHEPKFFCGLLPQIILHAREQLDSPVRQDDCHFLQFTSSGLQVCGDASSSQGHVVQREVGNLSSLVSRQMGADLNVAAVIECHAVHRRRRVNRDGRYWRWHHHVP